MLTVKPRDNRGLFSPWHAGKNGRFHSAPGDSTGKNRRGEKMSKFEQQMEKGGLVFWLVAVVCSFGLYGLLWFLLALGVVFNP
jgi:hypothetical protein